MCKTKDKKVIIFIPLLISMIVAVTYFGIYYLLLKNAGLTWRPYVFIAMIIVVIVGIVSFFLLLLHSLFVGLKQCKTSLKIVRLVITFIAGVVTVFVVGGSCILISLSYQHEEVVKIDDKKYVCSISDWNPIYYYFHEYDGWFTMAEEPFMKTKAENVKY